MDDEPLHTEILELSATRPTMAWLPWLGALPVQGVALLVTVFGVIMALTGSAVWLLPIPACWWVGARVVSLDYHAFTRIDRWLSTSAFSIDASTEGGASTAPFPIHTAGVFTRALAAVGIRSIRPRGIS